MQIKFVTFRKNIIIQAIFLLFSLPICQAWATNTWTSTSSRSSSGIGYNSTTQTYTIYTCSQLAWLADQVNAGTTFAGYTFILADDLNLNNLSWTPIGNGSTAFKGTFDGANHTISNMSIGGGWGYNYWGLFGQITAPVILKNINLTTISVSQYYYVGGLVGFAQGSTKSSISPATISYCTVTGTINCSNVANGTGGLIGKASDGINIDHCATNLSLSSAEGSVGGLIGSVKSSSSTYKLTLSFCTTSGTTTVTKSNACGGVIGSIEGYSSIQDCSTTASVNGITKIGGFVGQLNNNTSTFTRCSSTGTITGSNNYLGGFVGDVESGSTFTSCFTSGNLNATGYYLGGFAGYINDDDASFTNCYTTGTIQGGSTPSGGFVGSIHAKATLTGCYSTGNLTCTNTLTGGFVGSITDNAYIYNCYATGNVTTTNTYAAGFVAQSTAAPQIINCYSTGKVIGTYTLGGFIGASGSYDIIANCYATGPVITTQSNGSPLGGFIGIVSNSNTSITNCYATGTVYGYSNWGTTAGGGGFAGQGGSSSTFTNCYFDSQSTGCTLANGNGNSTGITGLTTDQMITSSGFGLDNSVYSSSTTIWEFVTGYYPQLKTFKSGITSGYSIAKDAIGNSSTITIPGETPTSIDQSWSALSVVPLYLVSSNTSTTINNAFTVPTISAQTINSSLSWSGDSKLTYPAGGDCNVGLAGTGTVSFQATDQNNFTKSFFINITGAPYYVRIFNGNDNNDGKSWATAFKTIQKAVETAYASTNNKTIYVAAGTYTQTYTDGDYAQYPGWSYWGGWSNTFVIRDGVNVYGGFPEFQTTDNNNANMLDRVLLSNTPLYKTTLQGGTNRRVLGTTYENAFYNGTLSSPATWDGFTLTGTNMTTHPNYPLVCGGGAFLINNCTLSNCIIENNSISNNNDGAGVLLMGGTIKNSIIRFNTTAGNISTAGGIGITNGNSNVINCLIYGNSDIYGSGGIFFYANGLGAPNSLTCNIINNTIANNTSSSGVSGVNILSGTWNKNINFYNNAVWNNSFKVSNGGGTEIVQYNGLPSAVTGTGNIVLSTTNDTGTNPPCFVSPTTNTSANYRLKSTSALIGKGSSTVSTLVPITDIRGVARNGNPDLGCYEYLPRTRYFVKNTTGIDNKITNGASWSLPFKTLQYALDQCSDPTDSIQIWVASGTYKPAKAQNGVATNTANSTFSLKQNVSIYGGFTGNQSTEYSSNEATMLGYINQRDLKNSISWITSNTSASSILVNYSSFFSSKGAVLDGFTITGAAAGSYAVAIDSATIQNCRIINNLGGGVSLNSAGNAYNVLIANNGGNGVSFAGSPNYANLVNATIVNNTGAAILSSTTTPTVKNSILWQNSGGNISGSTPTITNSAGTSSYGSVTWSSGSGNIDLGERSPNFKSPSAKNYELLLVSPCLNAADATANTLPTDANGNSRKYSGKIDMGAFQKWDGITISGNYSSYTIKNLRKGYTVPITKLTASNDTTEVLITPGTKFDMGGNSSLKVKWLEIKDSTVVSSSLNPPIITNGSITADSALYVRSFPLYVTGSTTVHAWNFFGIPYPVSVGKIEGATPESSVRIQQYNESTRAYNGANKSAWTNLLTTSELSVGTGYSLNLNAIKLPFRQTIIFPSKGQVTLSDSGSGTVSGLSYTSGSISWKENGWNFISNPYPQSAYIKYQSLPDYTYWPGTMTSGNSASEYAGGVFAYNSDGDFYDIWTLSDFKSVGLSPFGACFVKNGNVTPTLTKVQFVPETTASMTTTPLRTSSLTTAESTSSLTQFRVDIAGNNTSSRTYVLFQPNASSDVVELEDLPNWTSTSNGKNIVMNTFSSSSDIGLGINTLPFKGIVMEVPLQISVPAAGNYTISLPQKSDTVEVYIKDNTGTVTNLNTETYTFAAANATSADFTLLFKKTGITTDTNQSGITLVRNKTNVAVFNTDVMNRIAIYTAAGQLYKQKEINSNQTSFDLPTAPGIYLVKITTDKGTVTKKVINP